MAITCVSLASAAIIPATFTGILVPGPGVPYGPTRVMPVQGTGVRVVAAGGMAGWQITLIAVGAAILAATVAIRLDRALTARPAGLAITARSRPVQGLRRPAARRPVQRPGANLAGRVASGQGTNLLPATPPPDTPDTVQFGRNALR
jgi:hypothetical protein